MELLKYIVQCWKWFEGFFEKLSPLGDLLIRYWLWNVFFYSGLTKFQNFEMTVQLFANEYQIPLLSPFYAAWLGTFVEIAFSTLVLVGFGGRLPTLILFIFNLVAVFSYPYLWTIEGSVGRDHHWHWGLLLLFLLLHGSGKLSLDYIWQQFRKTKLGS